MSKEIDELKFLSPEQRLKRLKKLEEERKKEIKEAHKLIVEAEEELVEKEKQRIDIPIEQLKSDVDEQLFGEPEDEMFRMKRFTAQRKSDDKDIEDKLEIKLPDDNKDGTRPLEETVFNEKINLTPEQAARQQEYQTNLSHEATSDLYGKIQNIYQTVNEQGGDVNDEQRNQLYNINRAMEMKEEDIKSGTYDPTDYIKHEINLGERMIRKIMGDYTK